MVWEQDLEARGSPVVPAVRDGGAARDRGRVSRQRSSERSRRIGSVVGALCVAAIFVSGCSGPRDAARASGPDPVTPPASGPVPVVWDDGSAGTLPPPLPNGPTVDAEAVRVGTEVMSRYTDHGLSSDEWWQALVPLLAPGAQVAYLHTDPASVSAHRLTGPAALSGGVRGGFADVAVPTDSGEHHVLLTRSAEDPQWRAVRIVLPPRAGGPRG